MLGRRLFVPIRRVRRDMAAVDLNRETRCVELQREKKKVFRYS